MPKMAYKRHRMGSWTSSRQPPCSPSHPQAFSRMSSVPRNIPPSSPAVPPLSQRSSISLGPYISQISTASSSRDEDVIRALDETDADIQQREDFDALNETIMAVEMKERGSIGCAYYIAREEKLCLMEDIKMAGLEIVDTLKLHTQPTVILISTRCEEKLEKHLSTEARGIDRGDEASQFMS